MPFGMDVGLGPGHIVLDGDPTLPTPKKKEKGTVAQFSVHVYCGLTVAYLSYCIVFYCVCVYCVGLTM